MFDTIIDTINSMLGITILTISGTSIFCFFTKSTVIQKIIQCIGFSLWVSFWIGIILFRDTLELLFNITIIIFVVLSIKSHFLPHYYTIFIFKCQVLSQCFTWNIYFYVFWWLFHVKQSFFLIIKQNYWLFTSIIV